MKKNDVVIEKGMVVTLKRTKVTHGSADLEGSSIIIEDMELNGEKVSRVKGEMGKEEGVLTVQGKLIGEKTSNLEVELEFTGAWTPEEIKDNETEYYDMYLNGSKLGVAEVQPHSCKNKEEVAIEKN